MCPGRPFVCCVKRGGVSPVCTIDALLCLAWLALAWHTLPRHGMCKNWLVHTIHAAGMHCRVDRVET